MIHEAKAHQQEVDALKARIAQLESLQPPPQPKEAAAPPEDRPCAVSPEREGEAVFPRRTDDLIACPRCGRRQRGNRNFCYSCELPFRYEEP